MTVSVASESTERGPSEGHREALLRGLAVFGHDSLRPGQSEIIQDIFDGRSVIAVMPTGAGKSLCYQLPAVVLAAQRGLVTLVVSPLIALMKDQVDTLVARGVPAVALTSQAGHEEQRQILEGIRAGMYSLVYVAPERFRSPRFCDALDSIAGRIGLVAIDEAHCISEWGHDFRPDYRRLGEVIKRLDAKRIAAFTATATPEVRRDIAVQLDLQQPRLHVRGFDRPNLTYIVETIGGPDDKSRRLQELVRLREGGVALVYAATRKNAEKYATELKATGMRCAVYHAGLEDKKRSNSQDAFMSGQLDAIVATNAFGMGVDKRDIRLVVHADIPRSPEAYYQEAGRGGRDGKPTKCVLLFNYGDIRLQNFLIDASYPSADVLRGLWKLLRDHPELGKLPQHEEDLEARVKAQLTSRGLEVASTATAGAAIRILERHGMLRRDDERIVAARPEPSFGYPVLDVESLARRAEVERSKLKTMVNYAYHPRCRRQYVLDYFGDQDWASRDRSCGACDNCDAIAHGRKPATFSDAETKAIRSLLLLVGDLNGRFGRTRIAKLAAGTDDDTRFEELVERGGLRTFGEKFALDLLRALEGAGLVETARGEYPTIKTTRRGDQVAVGKFDLTDLGIQMPTAGKAKKKSRAVRSRFK